MFKATKCGRNLALAGVLLSAILVQTMCSIQTVYAAEDQCTAENNYVSIVDTYITPEGEQLLVLTDGTVVKNTGEYIQANTGGSQSQSNIRESGMVLM